MILPNLSVCAFNHNTSGSNRQQCATINADLDLWLADSICSASIELKAIGFSTSTGMPDWRAARVCGACRKLGVQITSASAPPSISNSFIVVYCLLIPNWLAKAADLSEYFSTTATTCPPQFKIAWAW